MTDAFVGIDEPTTVDKKMQTYTRTVGSNTVHAEAIVPTDPDGTAWTIDSDGDVKVHDDDVLAAVQDLKDPGDPLVVGDDPDIVVDGTAGGVILLAANGTRKGFLIQNTAAAGVKIRVRIDGDPTATLGVQLDCGQAFGMMAESSVGCPVGEIKAIREGVVSATASVTEFT